MPIPIIPSGPYSEILINTLDLPPNSAPPINPMPQVPIYPPMSGPNFSSGQGYQTINQAPPSTSNNPLEMKLPPAPPSNNLPYAAPDPGASNLDEFEARLANLKKM